MTVCQIVVVIHLTNPPPYTLLTLAEPTHGHSTGAVHLTPQLQYLFRYKTWFFPL